MFNSFTTWIFLAIVTVILIVYSYIRQRRIQVKYPTCTRVSDHDIQRLNADGKVLQEIRWDEIEVISIRTTDQGPGFEDFFDFLESPSLNKTVVVSDEDQYCPLLVARIRALQGLDSVEYGKAIRCTDHGWFEIWRKQPA